MGSEKKIKGYKQGTENVLIDHFSRYGTVVKHETIDGRLLVQFKETSSAISALKSNGFDCEGQQVTVKLHNMTATESDQSDKAEELPVFKKIETPSDLYKRTNKLGSGQSGITALDKNISIKPTDKPKEVSLYTRLLEVILGW
jgi:hypothetical protein